MLYYQRRLVFVALYSYYSMVAVYEAGEEKDALAELTLEGTIG